MSTLEIIHLRSSRNTFGQLTEQIRDSIRNVGDEALDVAVYNRRGLDTDIAVRLVHYDTPRSAVPSELGLRLAAALREYGMVEYTVWERVE